MTKKTSVTHAPFDSHGNLLHYPGGWCYTHNFETGKVQIDWRPNEPFAALMTLQAGVTSGRSAKYVHWHDEQGHRFPMFVADLVGLAANGIIEKGTVRGWWMVAKRGANFGLRLATPAETPTDTASGPVPAEDAAKVMQFNGMGDYFRILQWMKDCADTCALAGEVRYMTPIMLIQTGTGTAAAEPGDWIVQNTNGRFRVRRAPTTPTLTAAAATEQAVRALGCDEDTKAVRILLSIVARMRDTWSETDDDGRADLWKGLHDRADAVEERFEGRISDLDRRAALLPDGGLAAVSQCPASTCCRVQNAPEAAADA